MGGLDSTNTAALNLSGFVVDHSTPICWEGRDQDDLDAIMTMIGWDTGIEF